MKKLTFPFIAVFSAFILLSITGCDEMNNLGENTYGISVALSIINTEANSVECEAAISYKTEMEKPDENDVECGFCYVQGENKTPTVKDSKNGLHTVGF